MALRDLLAGEAADHRRAADAAARGQSLTGLSGHHTQTESRFADGDRLFGERAEPVAPPAASVDTPIDVPRRRPATATERKPFGDQEQTLSYPERPGYRRYWANDRAGRIARFKEAGYDHVRDPESGEPVTRITDVIDGRGRNSYLMEIPLEWYQEDMAKNAEALERRLSMIKSGEKGQDVTVENSYARVKITGR